MRQFRAVATVLFLASLGLMPASAAVPVAVKGCQGAPPAPWCSDYTGGQCSQWPQSGCYIFSSTEEYTQGQAQSSCENYLASEECPWSVEAIQNACWWFCQFEMPGSDASMK